MEQHPAFLSILLIVALAAIIPIVVNRFRLVRLPIVVGEILAGIVIGQSGLNLVHETPVLTFLAEFGFVLLMFLSGLEISAEALKTSAPGEADRPAWQRPLPLAAIGFGLTVLLALGAGLGLTQIGLVQNPLLMGLILSTTSLGIVMPVLKERQLTGTTYGQVLLVSALLGDFVTLLLLSVLVAVLSQGLSFDVLLVMLLLVAFVLATRIGRWASRTPGVRRVVAELSHATAQIRVRGALALMIAWAVLAEALGVEVILGAFLAGAAMRLSSSTGQVELREKLDALGYGFFIPFFFIMVGARFDLSALAASPLALLLVPILIVTAYAVKLLPSLLLRTRFSWRETIAGGMLLSSRLSLIIAAAAIAFDLGLITSAVNSAVILVAIVTCTLSPIAFSRLAPAPAEPERRGVIVLGTDEPSLVLAERLRHEDEPVIVIRPDAEHGQPLRATGFAVAPGSPGDVDALERADATRARVLVAAAADSPAVVTTCRLARERYQIPTIIAHASDPDTVQTLRRLKVEVLNPSEPVSA